MKEFHKTKRTTLSRLKQRGSYDKETILSILDEAIVCQAGFIRDGHPVVLPMAYGRLGDKIYLHGARESPFLIDIASADTVCISVFHLDGLVFARSAFHHSLNFRSVVLYGKAEIMNSEADKKKGLKALMDKMLPGRWEAVQAPTSAELNATMVLAFPIQEASAKIRTGAPKDGDKDMDFPVWAGIVPLKIQRDAAITEKTCPLQVPQGLI